MYGKSGAWERAVKAAFIAYKVLYHGQIVCVLKWNTTVADTRPWVVRRVGVVGVVA